MSFECAQLGVSRVMTLQTFSLVGKQMPNHNKEKLTAFDAKNTVYYIETSKLAKFLSKRRSGDSYRFMSALGLEIKEESFKV